MSAGRFAELAQQRQQQLFDMPGDAQLGAVVRAGPSRAAARAGPCPRPRSASETSRVEIEDPRRVDQRRDEHRRRAVAAMVAQARAADPRDFGFRAAARLAPRRAS